MDDFLQMDIFFFVATLATLATLIFTILLVLILMRVLNILGHVERISKNVSEESGLVREDVAVLRESVHREGLKLRSLSRFAKSIFTRFSGKKRDSK